MAGAEREAHAHLASTLRSARQHQRRDVGGGEKQDEDEENHQHGYRCRERALLREEAPAAVTQDQFRQGVAGVERRRRTYDAGELRVERYLRGGFAHARFRAPQDVH